MTSGKGFTLIELLAVLVVIGLLAGAGTMRLSQMMSHQSVNAAIEMLVQSDEAMRLRSAAPDAFIAAELDLDAQQIRLRNRDEVVLTRSFGKAKMIEVRIAPGQRFAQGSVRLMCSEGGVTPTYACLFADSSGPQWIVFAGLTGSHARCDSNEQVESMLSAQDARVYAP